MGMAVLMALCSAMLEKNTRRIGSGRFLNLGGSLDMIHNAINILKLAVEKGASTLLIPLNARKQLNDAIRRYDHQDQYSVLYGSEGLFGEDVDGGY